MSMAERSQEGFSRFQEIRKEIDPSLDPIESWANAPAEIIHYGRHRITVPNGDNYTYGPGRRLIIQGKAVMDTCENPWAETTVDRAFESEAIRSTNRDFSLKVLERGAGLQIVGNRVLENLVHWRGGGEYHVIELNKEIAEATRKWADRKRQELDLASQETGRPRKVKIFVHEGDAREVSKRLIEEEGKKFNIIISDTYPLVEEEEGINDITDINILKNGLYRNNGVFGFFAFTPGQETDRLSPQQYSLVQPHFNNMHISSVRVNPAEGYDYLFQPDGNPVRSLPIVICSDKT